MKSLERIEKKFNNILKESFDNVRENVGMSNKPKSIPKVLISASSCEFDNILANKNMKQQIGISKERSSKLNKQKETLVKLSTDFSKKGRGDIKREMKISNIAFNHKAELNKIAKTARKKLINAGIIGFMQFLAEIKKKDQILIKFVNKCISKIKQNYEIIKTCEMHEKQRKSILKSSLTACSTAKKQKVCFAESPAQPIKDHLNSSGFTNNFPYDHWRQPSIHLNLLIKEYGSGNKNLPIDPKETKNLSQKCKAAIIIQKSYKKWKYRQFLMKSSDKKQTLNDTFVEVCPEIEEKQSFCNIF